MHTRPCVFHSKHNDYTRSPNDEKFWHNKQIDLLSYVYRSKDIHSLSLKIFDHDALQGKCTCAIFSVIVDCDHLKWSTLFNTPCISQSFTRFSLKPHSWGTTLNFFFMNYHISCFICFHLRYSKLEKGKEISLLHGELKSTEFKLIRE